MLDGAKLRLRSVPVGPDEFVYLLTDWLTGRFCGWNRTLARLFTAMR